MRNQSIGQTSGSLPYIVEIEFLSGEITRTLTGNSGFPVLSPTAVEVSGIAAIIKLWKVILILH